MKNIIIILTLCLYSVCYQGVDFSQISDSETLETFIRQRGTRIYQFMGQ